MTKGALSTFIALGLSRNLSAYLYIYLYIHLIQIKLTLVATSSTYLSGMHVTDLSSMQPVKSKSSHAITTHIFF